MTPNEAEQWAKADELRDWATAVWAAVEYGPSGAGAAMLRAFEARER